MEELFNDKEFNRDIEKNINIEDKMVNTPLHVAAENGNASIVKELIKKGADIKRLNKDGKNALQIAIVEGHQNVIKEILESRSWEAALRKMIIHYITLIHFIFYSIQFELLLLILSELFIFLKFKIKRIIINNHQGMDIKVTIF